MHWHNQVFFMRKGMNMKKKMLLGQAALVMSLAFVLGGCEASKTDTVNTGKSVNTEQTEKSDQADTAGKDNHQEEAKTQYEFEGVEPIDWDTATNLTKEQLEAASRVYSFYADADTSVAFNGFGEWMRADKVGVGKLIDVLSGEVKYYVATKSVYTEQTEPPKEETIEDSGYDTKVLTRLYESNGKMISDWEEGWYSEALGNWVVKYKNDGTNLVNVYNKDELEGMITIDKIDEEHALISGDNYCIMDKNGNLIWDLRDFDQELCPDATVYECNGYVIIAAGKAPSNKDYILNSEGKLLGFVNDEEDDRIRDNGLRAPYVIFRDQVYDVSTANEGVPSPITPSGLEVEYFDGEIAIYEVEDEEGNSLEYLYDMKSDKTISGKYTSIAYNNFEEDDAHVEFFYAYTNDKIDMLDRNGKVIKTVKQDKISQVYAEKWGVCCEYDVEDWYQRRLFDLELNDIDMGKYYSLEPLQKYDNEIATDTDMWIAQYNLGKDDYRTRIDILDSNFKPIFTGATYVGYLINDTMAVAVGNKVGVMDSKGNWLLRKDQNEFLNLD